MHCIPAGADLQAAIAKETGHPVITGTDAREIKASYDQLAAESGNPSPTATVILGYLWENENYSGAYIYFTADSSSGSPCSGYTYGFPYLGNYGWHDRADSMSGDSNCRMNLYSDPNYSGAQTGYQWSLSSLGLLHDAGDSLVFGS